jgi:hypothetical protein
MPPPDPLAPVIQALSYLIVPKPTVSNPVGTQTPNDWTGGSNTPTDGPFFTPAQVLLGLILGASADLTSLGNGINSTLAGVGSALANLADEIGTLESTAGAATVLGALQTVLQLIQGFVPPSAAGTLQSVNTLFGQLNSLLAQVALEANEMAAISQQLTATAPLFPAA